MIRLRVLGAIDLQRDDGSAIDAVLRQPKRTALLTYLAASSDGILRRRDVIVSMFWPEADDRHARESLSAALSFLRRHLGAPVIAGRGEEEIGCDPRQIAADIAAFLRAVSEDRDEEALTVYGGDLLPGFHVHDAPGFEEWLERERARLRALSAVSAARLAERAAAARALESAVVYARRAVDLAQDDEKLLRRLINLEVAAGDRASALRTFEDFAARLATEYGAAPSPETTSLAAAIRGHVPLSGAERPSIGDAPGTNGMVPHEARAARPVPPPGAAGRMRISWRRPVMGLGLPMTLFTWFVHRRTGSRSEPHARGKGWRKMLSSLRMRARPHVSWRRTAWGGVAALSMFVLLVVGFVTLRARGIGPWASLLAAGAITPRQPLLVADFRVTGADSTLGLVAAEATRASLSQSEVITVVGSGTVGGALRRMQRAPTERVTLTVAREIARREGLVAIVDGDVVVAEDHFILAMRLVTADSGRILFADRRTVKRRDLIDGLDVLSRKMRERIGESIRGVRATPALETVTTSSLEALERYTEASRANDLEEDPPKSMALLREAIELDTGFAMAWRKLGIVMGNAGQRGPARDSALERAFRLRHRLPELERLMAMAAYYWPGPGRDRGRAIDAYETGMKRGYLELGNNLALLYQGRREFARAESTYRRLIEARPDFALPFINIAVTQVNMGKLDEAESSLRLARRRFPTNLSAVRDASILLYHRGELERYQRSIDSLRRSQHASLRANAAYRGAYLALTLGRLEEFKRLWLEGNSSAGRSELDVALFDAVTWGGVDAVVRGDTDRAVRRLDEALATTSIQPTAEGALHFHVVAAYARAGRADRARAVLKEYEAQITDTAARRRHARPFALIALAEIALAENRFVEAVTLARDGDSREDGPISSCGNCLDIWLARAFDRAGQIDSAIIRYERYLTKPYQERYAIDWNLHPFANDPFNLARAYERLAQLYDAKGQRDLAVDYYGRFVTLWSQADRDLQPRVARARTRLSVLSRNTRRI